MSLAAGSEGWSLEDLVQDGYLPVNKVCVDFQLHSSSRTLICIKF